MRWSAIAGFAGGVAAVVAVVTIGLGTASPTKGDDAHRVYGELVAQAKAGDKRAEEAVRAIDTWNAKHDKQIQDEAIPDVKTVSDRVNGADLEVRNRAPWTIGIGNRTDVSDATSVKEYVASRRSALTGLLSDEAQLDVIVTPARRTDLESIARLVRGTPSAILVDWLFDGAYVMTSRLEIGEFKDWRQVEDDLADQVAASLDQYEGIQASQLTAVVRSVRLDVSADDAAALDADPSILLVDPTDDLRLAYADEAALVTVGDPPDLFATYAAEILGDPIYADIISPVKK